MNNFSKFHQNINSLINSGAENGTLHLVASQNEFDGHFLSVKGYENDLVNFMSNNYLGIGDDERVKAAAIDGINRYGIHASLARTYLMFEPFLELEEKLEKIFNFPTLLSSSTTMAHLSYLPVIVNSNDAIILDQFAHKSMMVTAQFLKGAGVHIEVIRHNQMEMLESRIKDLSEKYEKIWYLADSVYSMHGDFAPLDAISTLLNTHEKFHCYIDDAHGMSWIGENGKGYALHNLPNIDKVYISTSLNKAFGGYSAAMIFPNNYIKDFVRNCGAPLTFSAHPPFSSVTAALKIADIHLSHEIYEKQIILNEKIKLFKLHSKSNNLTVISYNHNPIFYIGIGNPELVINASKFLMQNGFMTSVASAPAVPLIQSGLRISININQTEKEIIRLCETIAEYIEDLELKGLFNREKALKGFKLNMKDRERELAIA